LRKVIVGMGYTIQIMTEAERLYAAPQSMQISGQSGCIGVLSGNIDGYGDALLTTWKDVIPYFKTQDFKDELDAVLEELRHGDWQDAFLKSRWDLSAYCMDHMDAKVKDGFDYGFRLDTQKYSYLLWLNPNKGEENLRCWCYQKSLLDSHMKLAEKGIRFIDSGYRLLFKIKDGEKVRISFSYGGYKDYTCRYIDDYHLEVEGFAYHICEYAEILEHNGHTASPVEIQLHMKREEQSR